MSDWGYYDKSDVIKNSKKAAQGVEANERELQKLRQEVKQLHEDQRKMLETVRRLTEAFDRMAQEMRQMREDMYPTSATTKKGLRPPATIPPRKP